MEKKLTRSRDKKVIAGIAGGLGEYLDIDPIIIRIIIVLITIFHGVGLLIYIIMWIVIPEEPYSSIFQENKTEEPGDLGQTINEETNKFAEEVKKQSTSSNGRTIFGVILIGIGLIFFLERFLPIFDFELIFSSGLIILGLALVFNFFNKSEKSE